MCALMQRHFLNYCLSPPRRFCSPKLSLFPSPCITPRTLEMRDGEDKDYYAHSTDEEANPGGAESHRVPRNLEPKFPSCLLPLYPTVLVCLHAQTLPTTWCREVSGDSCRVTGSMGQPPAKRSRRHCQGWGKAHGGLGQPAPPPGCPSQTPFPQGTPLTLLLTTSHPDTPAPESTHPGPWSPGRRFSPECLHQVLPSHSAHQYLRLCVSGEGVSHVAFTGQLLCAENSTGHYHVSWETTATNGLRL